MLKKIAFVFLLSFSGVLLLAACAPQVTQTNTAGSDAVASAAAPTLTTDQNATQTATGGKLAPTTAPTLQLTQPGPTEIAVAPTVAAAPTAETKPPGVTQIAYIKNGDVYLWREGAGSVSLTDTGDGVNVRLSDDGSLVAYVRQKAGDLPAQELWAVTTEDPPKTFVLVSQTDLSALKPSDPDALTGEIGILDFAWRHNTHELVYDTLLLHQGPGFSPSHDLHLVNVDTLTKTTLLGKGEGGLFYISPDGRQIALSHPDSISLINADGSNMRQDVLTFPPVLTYSEYQYHPHPIWAPDSSTLRVAIPPEDPLVEPLPATSLWLIPTDGSPAELLGNILAMPFAWPDNAFSPNLEHVIYAMPVGEPTENLRELRVAKPDGSGDEAYDKGESLEFKLWSPDSQHFIYEINGGANEGLYLGALDAQPTRIYADPHAINTIQWLDTARYAYLLAKGDQWELRITNLNGDDLAFIDTLSESYPIYDSNP